MKSAFLLNKTRLRVMADGTVLRRSCFGEREIWIGPYQSVEEALRA